MKIENIGPRWPRVVDAAWISKIEFGWYAIIYNIAGTGRIIEAEKVLRKAANVNKRTLPQLNFTTQVKVDWEIEFVFKFSV